jgi:replicative DNA helicase Mcm
MDTIFVLRDDVEEESDEKKVEAMLNSIASGEEVETVGFDESDRIDPPLSRDEIQAWVAYARQHHTVAFDMETLQDRITEYYVDIRDQSAETGAPVNLRKVGSILRYALASARIRLGESVEESDIDRAISIVNTSLAQIGMTEDGRLSVDSEVAENVTQADRKQRIRDALNVEEAMTANEVAAQIGGVSESTAAQELEDMAEVGDVLRPAHGEYRAID